MNFFLYINRKLIFFSGGLIIFSFLILVLYKQFNIKNADINKIENNLSDADISEPKFAINNESKKIYITAREGNFLNKDEVLLKDSVRFKSNDFNLKGK